MYVSRTIIARTNPNSNDTLCASSHELLNGQVECYMKFDASSADRMRIIEFDNNCYLVFYIFVAPADDRFDDDDDDDNISVEFNLLCMSEESEITNGETISDTLDDHGLKYYIYDFPYDIKNNATSAHVEFSFSLLSGDVTFFISNSLLVPKTNVISTEQEYKFLTLSDVRQQEWDVQDAFANDSWVLKITETNAIQICETNSL